MTQPRKFSTASRKEIDITLQVIEGEIPGDMYGYVFLNSAAGTVNSNGLPFPETSPDNTPNQEFGSALINSDGMMYRFDFSLPGKIGVKTGLFRTPCYYADEATKWGTEKHHTLGFKNMGLARISSALGTRNELNNAIAPVRIPGEDKIRLLATFDVRFSLYYYFQ